MVAPHSHASLVGSRRLAIRLGRVHGSKAQSQRQREHRTRAARLCLRVRCACRGGARACYDGPAVSAGRERGSRACGEPAQQTGQETEGQGAETAQTLEPKAFSDYSWDELSQISARIATAATDDEGLAIAQEYNLADAAGVPVNETREVVLDDNTLAYARIVGFRHDQRADGSGVAGMTLMVSMLSEQPMETSNTNRGGWESSSLRAWLASDGMALLPDDLATHIVSVSKATNNVGLPRMSRRSPRRPMGCGPSQQSRSAATSRGLRMSLLQRFPTLLAGRCAQRRGDAVRVLLGSWRDWGDRWAVGRTGAHVPWLLSSVVVPFRISAELR